MGSSMKESKLLKFLYCTKMGRCILKLLVQPPISKLAALYLSSALSRPLIGYYIRKYQIDMSGCEKRKFSSFNDFFTRKKYVDIDTNASSVISPCDGYMSVYQIKENLQMNIKHSTYTVDDLLENNELADKFRNGICCVFRLEPKHYHRYVYAVSGNVKKQKKISGVLHCVRPIACKQFPVYARNSREYILIQHGVLGSVVQMEVGALLVGKICNHHLNHRVKCGVEKGYFEFGGSTIILLFQENAIQLLPEYKSLQETESEIPITLGQIFGRINA